MHFISQAQDFLPELAGPNLLAKENNEQKPMYEQYLNEFEYVRTARPECAIRLKNPPYQDIMLYLGKTFACREVNGKAGIVFDYELIGTPSDFDMTLINQEFEALLGGILLAILEHGPDEQTAVAV